MSFQGQTLIVYTTSPAQGGKGKREAILPTLRRWLSKESFMAAMDFLNIVNLPTVSANYSNLHQLK